MIIILYVFLGLMAVAVAITVIAIARAKDGYEDETGFHGESSPVAPDASVAAASAARRSLDPAVRAFESQTARTSSAELPSRLVEAR